MAYPDEYVLSVFSTLSRGALACENVRRRGYPKHQFFVIRVPT